ncbi:MAG: UvrD-helicase domain-containing protein [Desulfovibrionaceae bacterium]|nr:UvrD-helicase domain-containing protein [Desulfovibrionaceae bacterium]
MQEFLADLHIHSRFSRATSRKLNLPLLAAWARLKGIAVLGTGDFTHPRWREELRDELILDEDSGLYVLKKPGDVAAVLPELPVDNLGGTRPVRLEREAVEHATGLSVPLTRFMLQGEISSIYKRGGKVRKVHNLVFMPTLEAADAFCLKLGELGNLHSDGRPILGLDSRDLLELVLEAHPQAFLVPAHIWTPWFSLFGSKSGFDHLTDCYGDLSPEIFALETGLSSDPSMIRLWSELDNFRLVSNSDAHSGENLGRELNMFSGDISYAGMLQALKHPEQAGATVFRGTLEFFPEEGKYHMDGHRKCNVVLSPKETKALGGICPVCGEALTVGVLHRVMELADRDEPEYQPGDGQIGKDGCGFISFVALTEILGEILGVGSKSRKVSDMYASVLERFGPELSILRDAPEADLARFFPPLGEAVGRMRRGEVHLQGGYDGEYGVVRMFSDKEREEILRGSGAASRRRGGVQTLGLALPGTPPDIPPSIPEDTPSAPARSPARSPSRSKTRRTGQQDAGHPDPDEDFIFSCADEEAPLVPFADVAEDSPAVAGTPEGLTPEQERAVCAGPSPVLVLAGPGTGKTRTLIARILHLLDEGIGSRRILAVTFTRRAASEMDTRLTAALAPGSALPRTDTLHALALELWHKTHADVPVLLSEEDARRVFAEANPDETPQAIREAWQIVNLARERLEIPLPEYEVMGDRYMAQKNAWNLADYTDLLEFWLEQITSGLFTSPWGHVLVDEVQDLSPLQLTLVRSLFPGSGEGFFGIGDPDQSIYGFRGAHGKSLEFFRAAWPSLECIHLTRNYRSRGGILEAAHSVLGPQASGGPLIPARQEKAGLHIFDAPSAEAEANWIADRAAELIGLGSHTLADAKAAAHPSLHHKEADHSPGEIAVLVRTHALASVYRKALARKGVPVSEPVGDAFWADERVGLILHAAGRMLGIAVAEEERDRAVPVCPDKVLAKGPLGVAAYLAAFPPFDDRFWQSTPFRALVKAYNENNGWAGLISWISLQNELELVRAKGEKVQVISMHAAKGLEFRTVFVPALEDGLIPFAGPDLLTGKFLEKGAATAPDRDEAEERRLLYVALTRAKDFLYLSHADKRMLYGRELRLRPSRFLDAISRELLSRSTLVAKTTRKEQHLRLI